MEYVRAGWNDRTGHGAVAAPARRVPGASTTGPDRCLTDAAGSDQDGRYVWHYK